MVNEIAQGISKTQMSEPAADMLTKLGLYSTYQQTSLQHDEDIKCMCNFCLARMKILPFP